MVLKNKGGRPSKLQGRKSSQVREETYWQHVKVSVERKGSAWRRGKATEEPHEQELEPTL